jgi:hypothetical protein
MTDDETGFIHLTKSLTQHHNHPLSIEGGQLDFALESKGFHTSAAIIARSMSLSSSRVRSLVLYVITRFDKA